MEGYTKTNEEIVSSLSLVAHPEGGYYVETDRREITIPSPYSGEPYFLRYTSICTYDAFALPRIKIMRFVVWRPRFIIY